MPRYLALDADHGRLYLVAATVKSGNVRLEKALAMDLPQPLSVENAREVGLRLKDQMKTAGIAAAPTLIGLSRERVIFKEAKYPGNVSPREEPGLIRFQTIKELADNPDDVVIDYQPGVVHPTGEKLSVVVIAKKEVLAPFHTLCLAAGLPLQGVTPRCFATLPMLLRAMQVGAVNGLDPNQSTFAILLRGEHWAELVICRHAQVVFARPLGPSAMHSETARLSELRRNFTVFSTQTGQTIEAVYVSESDPAAGWAGRLREGMTTTPVYAFDPLLGTGLDVPSDQRSTFGSLIGLLRLQASREGLPINLAAPRQPVAEDNPNRQLITIGLGLTILLGLLLFGFGLQMRMARDRTIARLNQEKSALEAELAELEIEEKRIKAVEDWQKREIVWLDELYDLTDRFVDYDKARVTQLVGSPMVADKNNKNPRAGVMKLTIITEDSKAIDRLMAEMVRDQEYLVHPKEPRGSTGATGSRFNQQYILTAEINHREPKKYSRQLTVSPPKKDKPGEDEVAGPLTAGGME